MSGIITPKCPQCGAEMPGGSTDRVCPRCAAAFLKAAPTEMPGDATGSSRPFTPPPVAELAPLFPQLEILELIGQGGMGAVYKARQKELDRIVALKILPPGIGDAAFAERFAREAKALARLNHPGIVTIYEFGRSNGLFFFLMEFVDGVTLRHVLEAGRISPREALAIVPGICDALQYAHDQGIVHRDIKPENILLDRRGRTKVADFGLARLVESGGAGSDFEAIAPADSSTVTHSGKVLGTPQYMAPEQFEHPATVDHRADIYALGVVFYQMLTGELPGQRIEPPSKKVRIDVRLDEVVLRALEKNPDRRYAQASALRTQVETIAQTGESRIRKPGMEQKMKRRTLLATLITGVLCLVIGLAVWIATRPPRFSMENIDSKIAQLSKPGTTADRAIRVLGVPLRYAWENKSFRKDALPQNYVMLYPHNVSVSVSGGYVFELRCEGRGGGFTYRGKLHLGSSLDDVLEVLGQPTDTVVGKPIDFSARSAGVLFRDVDGEKGRCYYARPEQNIRCFFDNDKVTALFVPLEGQ